MRPRQGQTGSARAGRGRRARTRVALALVVAALPLLGVRCSDKTHQLRGYSVPSPDGKTRLVVDDDNGGAACRAFKVDGKRWRHAVHQPGEIAPGPHVIECGGDAAFEVPEGTTFHFDYWGP